MRDEERYEEEPDPDDGLGTYQTYDLWTNEDGSISGRAATNDNLDRGYPTETAVWDVGYRNREAMLRQLSGGSHRGFLGCEVTVRYGRTGSKGTAKTKAFADADAAQAHAKKLIDEKTKKGEELFTSIKSKTTI